MDADKQVGNLIPGKVPGVEDTKNNFEQSAKASTITKEPWSVQVERADNQENPEAAEVQGVVGAEANNVDPELFATGPVQEEPSHMEDGNANWNLGGVGLPSGLLRNNDRNLTTFPNSQADSSATAFEVSTSKEPTSASDAEIIRSRRRIASLPETPLQSATKLSDSTAEAGPSTATLDAVSETQDAIEDISDQPSPASPRDNPVAPAGAPEGAMNLRRYSIEVYGITNDPYHKGSEILAGDFLERNKPRDCTITSFKFKRDKSVAFITPGDLKSFNLMVEKKNWNLVSKNYTFSPSIRLLPRNTNDEISISVVTNGIPALKWMQDCEGDDPVAPGSTIFDRLQAIIEEEFDPEFKIESMWLLVKTKEWTEVLKPKNKERSITKRFSIKTTMTTKSVAAGLRGQRIYWRGYGISFVPLITGDVCGRCFDLHKSNECIKKDEKLPCRKCGSFDHHYKNPTTGATCNEPQKCITCARLSRPDDHRVRTNNCPIYMKSRMDKVNASHPINNEEAGATATLSVQSPPPGPSGSQNWQHLQG